MATDFSQKLFSIYKFEPLKDLGSRIMKYWFIRCLEDPRTCMLQMTMKQSTICQLTLGKQEIFVLKDVLKCLKNPLLLTVDDLEVGNNMMSVLVEFVPGGSLRDIMYKANPYDDWATKYPGGGYAGLFKDEEIAICGRYILEAVLLLYKQGFPVIGQIHAGNIFKIGHRYVLGGYENTLLGYTTALFSIICKENLLEHMDEIMFGLLLYEMATGCYTNQVLLDQLDCQSIHNFELKEVLQVLTSDSFRRIDSKERRIQMILEHQFFQGTRSFERKKCFEYTPEGLKLLQYISFSHKKFSVDELFVKIDDVLGQFKGKYRVDCDTCHKIGWRNGKTWAKVNNTMLSAIEVPYTCPIFVKSNLETIRKIMKLECASLLEVYDVQYVRVRDSHVIVFVKQYVEKGSLKDRIYRQNTPLRPWNVKYNTQQSPQFSQDDIAIIGAQILSVACKLRLVLGSTNSPLSLSFIHSGNIFWDGRYCRIGGLENKLLGCRPRDYVKYRSHLNRIDEVMFGNLIFELATGKELVGVLPTETEYNCLNASFRKLLKKIFDNTTTLEEILHFNFFQNHPCESAHLEEFKDHDIKNCLEKIQKGKHRNQNDEIGRAKYNFVQKPLKKLDNYFLGNSIKYTNTATGTSSVQENM